MQSVTADFLQLNLNMINFISRLAGVKFWACNFVGFLPDQVAQKAGLEKKAFAFFSFA